MNAPTKSVRVNTLALALVLGGITGCASPMPRDRFERFEFPKESAFLGQPARPHEVLGRVRERVNFATFGAEYDETRYCRNYFNKAVQGLVKAAKAQGADAVVEIRAVTLLESGQWEAHKTPECSDDGTEGQILAEGIAVKWKPAPPPSRLKR